MHSCAAVCLKWLSVIYGRQLNNDSVRGQLVIDSIRTIRELRFPLSHRQHLVMIGFLCSHIFCRSKEFRTPSSASIALGFFLQTFLWQGFNESTTKLVAVCFIIYIRELSWDIPIIDFSWIGAMRIRTSICEAVKFAYGAGAQFV